MAFKPKRSKNFTFLCKYTRNFRGSMISSQLKIRWTNSLVLYMWLYEVLCKVFRNRICFSIIHAHKLIFFILNAKNDIYNVILSALPEIYNNEKMLFLYHASLFLANMKCEDVKFKFYSDVAYFYLYGAMSRN